MDTRSIQTENNRQAAKTFNIYHCTTWITFTLTDVDIFSLKWHDSVWWPYPSFVHSTLAWQVRTIPPRWLDDLNAKNSQLAIFHNVSSQVPSNGATNRSALLSVPGVWRTLFTSPSRCSPRWCRADNSFPGRVTHEFDWVGMSHRVNASTCECERTQTHHLHNFGLLSQQRGCHSSPKLGWAPVVTRIKPTFLYMGAQALGLWYFLSQSD